ncbi:Oidioi.mRNA.OKI2018_I69.PAR.g9773.t1.cds [Oikopleura dioica]|uniref:procollagen-proline 4-dioxygenase n=1 Tax=Oikopleura dioica TaxID=34765 RepID=A0ABN7RN68_OIKDI|nr:Oidioi.mRNA.OKI2018_I69.PAR.g9773.t1.cds [Oikopleura dioica]
MKLLNFLFLNKIFAQEIFSSKKALEELSNFESQLIESLLIQIEEKLGQYETLRDNIENVKNLKSKSSIDHPIEQYKIIRRFLTFWTSLQSEIEESLDFQQFEPYPNRDDLVGAAEGIFRIQDVYALDSFDLAEGMELGVKDKEPSDLTVEETLSIGKIAYWKSDHYHSALWLVAAWQQNQIEENDGDLAVQILDHLAISIAELGDLLQALEITAVLMQMRPEEARYQRNYNYYLEELGLDQESTPSMKRGMNFSAKHLPRPEAHYESMREYERLCREFSPPHKPNLKCFYWTGPSPLSFLQWAPVKTEELHDDPLIVQFYEVVSNEEEKAIQLLAGEHLNRATIQDPATGELVNADYRIQKTAWLTEHEKLDVNGTIAKYNRKLTQITGLDADFAELVQVGNYGVAGQYEPHWDHQSYPGAENRWDPAEGSRIATWLAYMSEPNMGGGTVFIQAGIQARPVRNSAVFWYNLLPSGESDDNTQHAACPVLSGTKWVSNKWFHERGQEFRRKCALDENTRNTYL